MKLQILLGVHHVHVRPEPDVVGEVPAYVIGIFVNDYLVRIPAPVIAEAKIIGSDGKVEAAEPKALAVPALDPPHVFPAKATRKTSMFPGMLDAIMIVGAPGIVADPFVVAVNVRGFRMPAPILISVRRLRRGLRTPYGSGTVRRNMASADRVPPAMAFVLRHRRKGETADSQE